MSEKFSFDDIKNAQTKSKLSTASEYARKITDATRSIAALEEKTQAARRSIDKMTETMREATSTLAAMDAREAVQSAVDAMKAVQSAMDAKIEANESGSVPERLPKTALLIPEDGTCPDGLSTRTAARILYNGEEKILKRPERYVLSVFVYAENIDETTDANNNAKSKMTRTEIRRFIELRNTVFALYYLGQNLYNDVWAFRELSELLERFKNGEFERTKKDDPEAIQNDTRTLQMLANLQRLRLEAQFRAVDFFCKMFFLPAYLVPGIVTTARHDFKTAAQSVLFDEYADTVQADEIQSMTFEYLVQRRSKFSKNI